MYTNLIHSVSYPFYLITGQPQKDSKKFLELLKISLDRGIRPIQIRAKELNKDAYFSLASRAIDLCHTYQAKVLIHNVLTLITETNADGIHLPSSHLMLHEKRPLPKKYILSTACHNEEQIIQASRIEADIIVLCPVFFTPSSPNGKPLGWDQFSQLTKLTNLPIYALGGMTPQHLEEAKKYGAVGVAGIRAFWGNSKD